MFWLWGNINGRNTFELDNIQIYNKQRKYFVTKTMLSLNNFARECRYMCVIASNFV